MAMTVFTRRKALVIGAVALAAVALVTGAVLIQGLGPERVDPSSVHIDTTQPQQVSADAPAVPAPAGADLTSTVDVSAELKAGFAFDVSVARSQAQGEEVRTLEAEESACLAGWAKQNLSSMAAAGTYEVLTVCNRPTAVLAGPVGADSKVLAFGALSKAAPDGMRALIAESTSEAAAFAAIRTVDGKAQLLAMSPLD